MAKLPFKAGAIEKLGLGKMGVMGAAGLAIDAAFSYSDYKDAREGGAGRLTSAAVGIGNFAMYRTLGFLPTMAMQLLPEIPKMAVEGYESLGKLTRQMNQQGKQVPFVNSQFHDYNQAFTMRQAGMQMAQASQYNLQQSLMGNEAAMLQGR
jgi:hypothetical protein